MVFFGYAFLEREKEGGLRSVVMEDPDILFHGVMAAGIGYILMRTIFSWRKEMRNALKRTPELDMKLIRLKKPLLYRGFMWTLGGFIGAYGLYEKGDMIYALVFSIFLILITANRPSPGYFVKFFELKGEEKKWMES